MARDGEEFRTVRGYELLKQGRSLTSSMEDYLEMIYRICLQEDYARVHNLADQLNVQAPSVSRVIRKLADMGYVRYQRYGIIQLTDEGRRVGSYLLARHRTVELFLRNLGVGESLLTDTELIEHHLSPNTVSLLESLNAFHAVYPEILRQFHEFRGEPEGVGETERPARA